MEITGLINDIPVEALIKQAEAEEQTGVLLLRSDLGIGEIRFENGLIYSADAPFAKERLGYRLVAEGEIQPADLYRILRRQEEDQARLLGEMLFQEKLLSQERVKQVIEQQAEEAVLNILMWERGEFSFERKDPQNSHQVFIRPNLLLKEKKKKTRELKSLSRKRLMEQIQDL
jgi:hypothetical protein